VEGKIERSSRGTIIFARVLGYILLLIAFLMLIFVHPGAGLFFFVFSAMLLIPSYGKVEYFVHKFFRIKIVSILSVPAMIIAAYFLFNHVCEERDSRNKEKYMGCMVKKSIGIIFGKPYITID